MVDPVLTNILFNIDFPEIFKLLFIYTLLKVLLPETYILLFKYIVAIYFLLFTGGLI